MYRHYLSCAAGILCSQPPGTFDSNVSMRTHVTVTIRSCFAALRQIQSVRRFLSQHALLTLIRALVVSKVDYYCSVLAGVSGHLLDRLQSILNAAARLFECSQPGTPNASPRFSATFTGCRSWNGFSSISAFWHSDVSMDQCRHISLTAFIGQPMWKVIAISAHLPS